MSIRLSLMIPNARVAASRRVPAYVSSSTLSGHVIINGGPLFYDADLAVASPNCVAVNGGRSCAIPIVAPIGADTFAITLYDGACVGGPPCAHTGNALSAASSFAATIGEGQANVTLPLVLGGIPATAVVAVPADAAGVGTQHDVGFTLTARDAAGNIIVGPAPYVNSAGAAVPIVLEAGLQPTDSPADPQLVKNGTPTAATSITVAGPTDTLALRAGLAAQPIVGVEFRVTAGVTTLPQRAWYHPSGPTAGAITSNSEVAFLGGGSITTIAGAPYRAAYPASVLAGSSTGWVSNFLPTAANWTGGSFSSNTYCSVPTAATIDGLAVVTDGTFYASYVTGGGLAGVGYFQRGPANVPCVPVAGTSQQGFGLPGNSAGSIVIGNNTIFAINHRTSATALAEEVQVMSTDHSIRFDVPFIVGTSYGLAGAVLDPSDSSLWVVSSFADKLVHITGTAGVPASYSVATSSPLPSCTVPMGMTTDGTKLYISCISNPITYVATPAGGVTPPSLTTIATIASTGTVAAPNDIAIGPDGFLWIVDSVTSVSKYDRTTGGAQLAHFTAGTATVNGLVPGSDGELWLSDTYSLANLYRFGTAVGP